MPRQILEIVPFNVEQLSTGQNDILHVLNDICDFTLQILKADRTK